MFRALLTAVFCLISISFSIAQDYQAIDSLKDELALKTGETRTKILFSLAWEYRKSLPDSTLYYCREILHTISDQERDLNYAKVMNFMGVAYHYKGDDIEAYNYYVKALDAANNVGDSIQVGHALNNLGRFFLLQGDHVKSYENYSKAIEIFEQQGDKSSMSYGYKSLAELYMTQNNYEKALQMTQKTLDLRKEVGNVSGQISVLIEMAEIHLDMNDFSAGINYYEQAMLLASESQDLALMANIYLGIANAYCIQDIYDVALDEANKAEEISDKIGNQELQSRVNMMKGKLLFRLNRYAEAETYLNQMMRDLQRSGDLSVELEGSYYLALLYKSTGRYEQAFDKFQRHHELMSTLENAENARQIERLEARLEIESKVQENQLLQAQKAAAEANEDRLRLQNVLLTVGILAAIVIMAILYFMNKKRMETNRKLVIKNNFIATQREEIRNQNEQIALQNEKLRQRNEKLKSLNNEKDTLMNILAHDLKAPFNRVKGLLQLMEFTSLDAEQSKYVEMLNVASESGLNLIRDLLEVSAFSGEERKPVLTELSLASQLREKKESFRTEADSKHIDLKINLDNDIQIPADPSYLSRILDNLISNAIKFSEPDKEVILSGGKKNDVPYVSVKDFGPGFSEEDRRNLYHKFARLSAQPTAGESSNGLGLAIVKLLVDRLEAEIELVSEPGKGSEFIIRFPAHYSQEKMLKSRT